MSGQAWIQDPKTTNTMRFHFDPKSWSAHPMYFVDSGRPLPGAPPLLKTRSHMRRNDARELWLRLKAQGWKQVAPQWGADVDVCSWKERRKFNLRAAVTRFVTP